MARDLTEEELEKLRRVIQQADARAEAVGYYNVRTVPVEYSSREEKEIRARKNDLKTLRYSLGVAKGRAKRGIPGARAVVEQLTPLVAKCETELRALGVDLGDLFDEVKISQPLLRFLHPPRTSGSSLKRDWGLTRWEYQGHDLPEFPKPEEEYRYGFTRNPWDRTVSLFHLADPGHRKKDFKRWVMMGMKAEKHFGERFVTLLSLPTLSWLRDADFVGRFEQRDIDIIRLSDLLGRPTPQTHIAKSKRKLPFREYYDSETIEYVRGRYQVDIDVFQYTFEEES